LITNTAAVLKEEGIEVPQGLEVRAVENSDKVFHIVLPPKPDIKKMNDDQLQRLITRDRSYKMDAGFCLCSLLLDWSGLVQ
jgi:organic hydroperoxide reductase OsmC/OhrA